jgi:hypothetical protein
VAHCVTNNWRYDSILHRMKYRSDWADPNVYYLCLTGTSGCTVDIHPLNHGHLPIASIAANLYYNRFPYWVDTANVDSLQAGTRLHPLTTTQLNAVSDTLIPDGTKARWRHKYTWNENEMLPKYYRKQ